MMKKWWIIAALLATSVKLSAETIADELGDTYVNFVKMTQEQSVKDVLAPGQQMFLTSLDKTVKKNLSEVTEDQLKGVIFKLKDFADVVGEALKKSNKAQVASTVDSSVHALESGIEGLVGPKQAPQAAVVTTSKSGQPILHVQGVSGQTDTDTLEISGLSDEDLAKLDEEEAQALLNGTSDVLEIVGVDEDESSTDPSLEGEIELDLPIHPSLLGRPKKDMNLSDNGWNFEGDTLYQGDKELLEYGNNDGPWSSIVDTDMYYKDPIFKIARELAQAHRAKEEDLDTLLSQLTDAEVRRLSAEIEDEELLAQLTSAEVEELGQWIDQGMPAQVVVGSVQKKPISVEFFETLNRIAADADAVEKFLHPYQEAIRARIQSQWDDIERVLTQEEIRAYVLALLKKHQLDEAKYALAIDAFVNAFLAVQDAMWDELEPVYEPQPSFLGKPKRTNTVDIPKAKRLIIEEPVETQGQSLSSARKIKSSDLAAKVEAMRLRMQQEEQARQVRRAVIRELFELTDGQELSQEDFMRIIQGNPADLINQYRAAFERLIVSGWQQNGEQPLNEVGCKALLISILNGYGVPEEQYESVLLGLTQELARLEDQLWQERMRESDESLISMAKGNIGTTTVLKKIEAARPTVRTSRMPYARVDMYPRVEMNPMETAKAVYSSLPEQLTSNIDEVD